MNRDTIKYIAMFTMLLNHIANVFLTPGTLLFEVLVDVGYFTAITMCYFLVEGYHYTRSKEKYGKRLLLFAVVSQIPFNLAFTENGVIQYTGMNMIFTLFLCFLILYVREKVPAGGRQTACIWGLVALSLFSDWALLAPIFTIWFADAAGSVSGAGKSATEQTGGARSSAKGLASRSVEGTEEKLRRKKLWTIFGKAMLLFGLISCAGNADTMPMWKNLLCSAGAVSGILLSGICIIYFYNGKRAEKCRNFSKWFFYLFYPAHLLVLGMLRVVLNA